MRFLINDLIIYDTTLKTLKNKNFLDDQLELTPGSVAVLLDFLISYPHSVWTKEEIGEKAFADSSYSGSESNVNKSLSLLRRSFKELGEDSNIIATLPSQGIVFNANVTSYGDVSVPPVASRKTTSVKIRLILIACVLTSLTAIPALYYFDSLKPSECNLLNRGSSDAYAQAEKNLKQLRNCKAPGIIINGAHKKNESKKNYSLVAMCDQSSKNCVNFITK